MTFSEQTNEIAPAYVLTQGQLEAAEKDSVNPVFSSRYAGLASEWRVLRPALARNDLAALQEAVVSETSVAVTTRIIHKSGQWIEFEPLMIPLVKPTAHGIGSAITYAKRYALSAALGIVAEDEDDDGNAAVKPAEKSHGYIAEMPKAFPGGEPLTVTKVDGRWEGQPGKMLGFVTFSDGNKLPVFKAGEYAKCQQLEGTLTPVVIEVKVGASDKPYLNSVKAERTDPESVSEPLTENDIPFAWIIGLIVPLLSILT